MAFIPSTTHKKQNLGLTIFICLFIGAIEVKYADCSLCPGLDSPFYWFFNHLLTYDTARLAHVFHSTGPLALLECPMPEGDNIIIAGIYQTFLFGFFTFLFIKLYSHIRQISEIAVPAIISLIYLSGSGIVFGYLGISVVSILYYKYTGIRWPVFMAILFTVVGLYIKTSVFTLSLTVWIPFFILLLFKKEFKIAALFVFAGLVIYVFLGLLFFKGFAGIFDYTDNNIRMAFEYSDSSSLFPHNDWIAIGLCLLSLLIIAIAYRRENVGHVMALLSLTFFATWKQAIGREDFPHASIFFNIILLAFVISIAVQSKKNLLYSFLFLTSLSAYNLNMRNLGFSSNGINFPSFTNFYNCVLRNHQFKNEMIEASKRDCAPNIIPPDWIKKMEYAKVDVFPWDLSIFMVNNLAYNVRPSLQSGVFGLRSDRLDAII